MFYKVSQNKVKRFILFLYHNTHVQVLSFATIRSCGMPM